MSLGVLLAYCCSDQWSGPNELMRGCGAEADSDQV